MFFRSRNNFGSGIHTTRCLFYFYFCCDIEQKIKNRKMGNENICVSIFVMHFYFTRDTYIFVAFAYLFHIVFPVENARSRRERVFGVVYQNKVFVFIELNTRHALYRSEAITEDRKESKHLRWNNKKKEELKRFSIHWNILQQKMR